MDVFSPEYWNTYCYSYLAVFLLTYSIAVIEVADNAKYKTFQVTFSLPGFLYAFVNGAIGALALFLMHTFGLNVELNDKTLHPSASYVAEILVVGFGSLAVLRSSIIKFSDSSFGPDQFVNKVLNLVKDKLEEKKLSKYHDLVLDCGAKLQVRDIVDIILPYCGEFTGKTEQLKEKSETILEGIIISSRKDELEADELLTRSKIDIDFYHKKKQVHNAILLYAIAEIINWETLDNVLEALEIKKSNNKIINKFTSFFVKKDADNRDESQLQEEISIVESELLSELLNREFDSQTEDEITVKTEVNEVDTELENAQATEPSATEASVSAEATEATETPVTETPVPKFL